jgi:1,5-anhydro-D-fructose reductase (1,5-anhydro-D-mannitol-forming)
VTSIARDDIDAVTVTTATSAHRAIMLCAAQAGKHIFTEKLLAPTVDEAEEIIGMADGAGVALRYHSPGSTTDTHSTATGPR